MPTAKELNDTFAILVAKAVAGERCPQDTRRDTEGLRSSFVMALCDEGRIRIKISGRNYRTVEILIGPHKGKTTAPDPLGGKVWRVFDGDGEHRPAPAVRRQPSAPRLLPYAGSENFRMRGRHGAQ